MSTRSNQAKVVLRPGERKALEALVAARTEPAATRAGLVLALVAGQTNQVAAKAFGMTPATVGRWRERFLYQRVAAVTELPPARNQRPRDELRRWESALGDVAQDRELLGLGAGRTAPVTVAQIRAAIARVGAAAVARLRILPLTRGQLDVTGAAALLEAADEAADTTTYASEIGELGRDATLPDVAAQLLTLAEAARRSRADRDPRPRTKGAPAPAAAPPRAAPPPIPADRIRRIPAVAPGDEPETAFPHLARASADNPGDADD
jgi:hypothetical protein